MESPRFPAWSAKGAPHALKRDCVSGTQIAPSLAERAPIDNECFGGDIQKVDDGGLHRGRAGGGQERDGAVCLEEMQQATLNLVRDFGECLGAIVRKLLIADRQQMRLNRYRFRNEHFPSI